jgi:hypothetical protein
MTVLNWLRKLVSADTTARKTPSLRRRLTLEHLEARAVPAIFVWTGNVNTDWNNGANWAGGITPGANNSVTFIQDQTHR